ncbi:EcoAI/FtnUII family type I restriction enzme subunit R [Caldanaerobacter subterraneus]|uniref:DEAD/DEAH box helicase family protein n=1 Tax=Caldanaerobacter subterraneus TaxID=911092 RepID=A0A7Y2L8X1_9THEO|nr:DEAD/DEAH box helicase family protein [Caldanaerobacter subterraneus]NNG67983.1 DEAD/DEAH box helicase family protein [Caldanaerobacter subterraneus]
MNEADTRARLIEPKLLAAGWTDQQVTREFYYNRDYQYTPGKIILIGDRIRRGKAKKVDYLLRLSEGFPIAVVEAKAKEESAEAGLEQAKEYARDLGGYFAYSTNGEKIVECDFFTHTTRELYSFPKPQELWERWKLNIELTRQCERIAEDEADYLVPGERWKRNPLLYPYCPEYLCGRKPFYFQEVAIREVILRFMRGQRRVLLAMATGTGKTFIAFQIVWKLVKSGWLKSLHPDRPARVLFLADRVVLRDQAYNAFSPFADGAADPRYKIEGHPPNLNRDLYFGIYHTLWSQDDQGKRLFEKFPPDFFDLVIIDECHRSGWGTWREILDYFQNAIHLGMTATPKQDDNIDTYAYFCAEEPEIAIDPEHPEKGTWRPPAYQYSLGRGIEDGFLATYKVHRVRTTIDREGLRLQDAVEQGAEVFIPEEVEPREIYTTPQFEREITVPDRTRAMVKHLAGLLRRFGPLDKTMVFCVDMDHARLVARLLHDEFGPEFGVDNYAVPIVSEEGEQARRWLEDFASSEKKFPVVATTAELLSTGVDVPSCKNIVFMKTVSSPVLFKQIIGRGSRIDQATEKYWFRIIDFTGATRLFDQWDRPTGVPTQLPVGPCTAALCGWVFHAETGDRLVGARVSVRTGPNTQQGPIPTDKEGFFSFSGLPAGTLTLMVGAPGFASRELWVETLAEESVKIEIPLKPARRRSRKIRVEGLEVTIADEAIFLIEATGQQLRLEEYRDYLCQQVKNRASNLSALRSIWVNPEKRRAFLEDLRRHDIHLEALAEVMGWQEVDEFDFLAHLTFGAPIRTRSERATAFRNREQLFLHSFGENARQVILELLEKYRVGGIEQLQPEVFSVSPFREWGGAFTISRWFGGHGSLRSTLLTIQQKIYPEEGIS